MESTFKQTRIRNITEMSQIPLANLAMKKALVTISNFAKNLKNACHQYLINIMGHQKPPPLQS